MPANLLILNISAEVYCPSRSFNVVEHSFLILLVSLWDHFVRLLGLSREC